MNKNLYNIHLLGLGFMLVFSAFNPASVLLAIVLKDFDSNGIDSKTGTVNLSRLVQVIFSILHLLVSAPIHSINVIIFAKPKRQNANN